MFILSLLCFILNFPFHILTLDDLGQAFKIQRWYKFLFVDSFVTMECCSLMGHIQLYCQTCVVTVHLVL